MINYLFYCMFFIVVAGLVTTGNRIASELNPNHYSVIFMSYLLEISSLFNRTKFLKITVKRTVKQTDNSK